MVYFLDFRKKSYIKGRRINADGKPKTDVGIALSMEKNVKLVMLNNRGGICLLSRLFANLQMLFAVIIRFLFVRKQIIIIQYPFLVGCIVPILRFLKFNKNRICTLVHDIESLRTGMYSKNETLLLASDIIIAHTPQMKEALMNMGFKGHIEILEFFDYISDVNRESKQYLDKNVVFAGNLEKSTFLMQLKDISCETMFFLYGKQSDKLPLSKNVLYKGMFDADDIENVEGNWGLVWDGQSIDSCSGNYGEYLCINAPFKMSLYLAMNIPVIVWKKSAMAQYVNEYHLGICVNSLKEISSEIDKLSKEEIYRISQGVAEVSKEVRTGMKIRKVVRKLNTYDS